MSRCRTDLHLCDEIHQHETLYAIWYHLHNLRNVKNTHGGMLPLVTFKAEPCNFTKSNAPLWVFFTFFKLSKGTKLYKASHVNRYEILEFMK